MDVVVAECAAVFELLASKDETLLVWWDALLVLDLGLDVLDGIAGLDLEGDGFTGEGLDKDLHTTTQTQHQVKSRFFLDVVVTQSAAVLELLAGEDETLLVWRDSLLVLDFRFDILDAVAGLDLEGNGLSRQSFHEDLHTATQTQHQM